jgi:hypothetical protein
MLEHIGRTNQTKVKQSCKSYFRLEIKPRLINQFPIMNIFSAVLFFLFVFERREKVSTIN